MPSLLAGGDVDLLASFGVSDRPPSTPGFEAPMALGTDGGHPGRLVQLAFLNTAPPQCWDEIRRYGQAVDAGGVGRVTFAAAFIPTDVGTDRYTDQLW